MPKRKAKYDAADAEESTPRKTRRTSVKKDGQTDSPSLQAETPSGRKSILKGTPTKLNGTAIVEPTPKSLRKVLFSTPNRLSEAKEDHDEETPTATRNDWSARRKSARTLQRRHEDEGSDEEGETEREAEIARQILDEEDEASDEDEEADDVVMPEAASTADTPTKRGRPRGRPKGRQRQRTPSPPPELPPHELYFFQNRAGANKTSSNTLPSHLVQHHDDYFAIINAYADPHTADMARLQALHERAFDQWIFELEEGFNLCLYGYGSKRKLVMDFAEHFHAESDGKVKIVVVNGYTPGVTVRDILTTLSSVVMSKGVKLPAQPPAILDLLLQHLNDYPLDTPIQLIIHSLDHLNLRKHQTLIARLVASSSHVSLLATVDNPNFPLLWDTSLLQQFNWLYHDATTFQPYTAELDVADSVNELLGRSGRRIGGKDGVAFVLKSLPENARGLYALLIAEQLSTDTDPAAADGLMDDPAISDEELMQSTPTKRSRNGRGPKTARAPQEQATQGVEWRALFQKAVGSFLCTSELNFRTLLKEFYDHQMVESRRDALGTERLSVPFGREECEGILMEIG